MSIYKKTRFADKVLLIICAFAFGAVLLGINYLLDIAKFSRIAKNTTWALLLYSFSVPYLVRLRKCDLTKNILALVLLALPCVALLYFVGSLTAIHYFALLALSIVLANGTAMFVERLARKR